MAESSVYPLSYRPSGISRTYCHNNATEILNMVVPKQGKEDLCEFFHQCIRTPTLPAKFQQTQWKGNELIVKERPSIIIWYHIQETYPASQKKNGSCLHNRMSQNFSTSLHFGLVSLNTFSTWHLVRGCSILLYDNRFRNLRKMAALYIA